MTPLYRNSGRLRIGSIMPLAALLAACLVSGVCRAQNSLASFGPFVKARQVLMTDHAAALDWLVIGRTRLQYDAARCTDASAAGGAAFVANQMAGAVVQYAARHPRQYLDALKRVQKRDDLLNYDTGTIPAICANGIGTYQNSLGATSADPGPMMKDASEWPAIQQQIRQALDRTIAELEKKFAAHPPTDYEPAAFPTQVPAEVLSGSRMEKVRIIGAEARRAAAEAALESHDAHILIVLAQDQVLAGDATGAHETLTQTAGIFLTQADVDEVQARLARDDLIPLFVKVGDRIAAQELIASTTGTLWRISAMGKYGVALVEDGDRAAAEAVIDQIELAAKKVTDAELAATGDEVGLKNWRPKPEFAVRDIRAAMNKADDGANPEASTPDTGAPTPNSLVALAERQLDQGDTAAARASITQAYALIRLAAEAAHERFHQKNLNVMAVIEQPVAEVVDVQNRLGAYEDAMATAELEDPPNRPQYFKRIIQSEARGGHADALRKTLPRIVEQLKGQFGAWASFTELATILGHAGYKTEARDMLARAQADEGQRCAKDPRWTSCLQIAEAQLAIGDYDAPRAVIQAIDDPDLRDGVLRQFVQALAGAKDFSAVLPLTAEMAWDIQDPMQRSQAFISILRAF